jgi:hypothetical protein
METATSSFSQDAVSNLQEYAHTSIQIASLPRSDARGKAKVKEEAKAVKVKEKMKAEKVKEKVEKAKANRTKVTKKVVAKVTEAGLNAMRTVSPPEANHHQVNLTLDSVHI